MRQSAAITQPLRAVPARTVLRALKEIVTGLPSPSRVPAPATRSTRVEYLGFEDVGDHREFRLRIHETDEPFELRVRVASAAFGDGRLRSQDGPDICYQKLARAIAAGETLTRGGITLDDADLAGYRDAHTKVQRRAPAPSAAVAARRSAARQRMPQRAPSPPVAAPALPAAPEPRFGQGQRVSHTLFGVGVTTSSTPSRTVICFDEHGTKTFVTAQVNVEVLSAPHTWETGPRGKNRPCPPRGTA